MRSMERQFVTLNIHTVVGKWKQVWVILAELPSTPKHMVHQPSNFTGIHIVDGWIDQINDTHQSSYSFHTVQFVVRCAMLTKRQ